MLAFLAMFAAINPSQFALNLSAAKIALKKCDKNSTKIAGVNVR